MKRSSLRVLALAGGIGGAKLALGLSHALEPANLVVVGNTGDDETFFGLDISPDLDTLMYTLSGLADPKRGWGLKEESFNALSMLNSYGEATWFNLGDQDLATHVLRTQLLRDGWSLSQVTEHLSLRLGLQNILTPMSDDPVRTIIDTDEGPLPFQTYFVKRKCEPKARKVYFDGAEQARMSPTFAHAMEHAQAIVLCPSNPILSIGPILSIPGVLEGIRRFTGTTLAVSPIVGSQALRGPAAKMMKELGEEVSPLGIARRLTGICDILVLDTIDARFAEPINTMGLQPFVTNTVMETLEDKERLAAEICDLVQKSIK